MVNLEIKDCRDNKLRYIGKYQERGNPQIISLILYIEYSYGHSS